MVFRGRLARRKVSMIRKLRLAAASVDFADAGRAAAR
jgi:hypothetical protein